MANAADGDRRIPYEAVALLSHTAPTPLLASVEPPEAKKFPGFFGYLEFDFDPDAPDGVPGFGGWAPSAASVDVAQANRAEK
jgi:hypothetical protein